MYLNRVKPKCVKLRSGTWWALVDRVEPDSVFAMHASLDGAEQHAKTFERGAVEVVEVTVT